MYRLQWTHLFNADGTRIDPKNFVYHDTVFEYEDRDEAMEDRIKLMAVSKDKYIRIVEVE